jgi:hypothetical protein
MNDRLQLLVATYRRLLLSACKVGAFSLEDYAHGFGFQNRLVCTIENLSFIQGTVKIEADVAVLVGADKAKAVLEQVIVDVRNTGCSESPEAPAV